MSLPRLRRPSIRYLAVTALAAFLPALPSAQQAAPARTGTVVVRGGWLFTATSGTMVRHRGILGRGGRLLRVNADLSTEDTAGARVVRLGDDEYVIPASWTCTHTTT